jgi:hypothetical protein
MTRAQTDPIKTLFDGVIHSSGKGFYVGAELFAILSGRLLMEDHDLIEKGLSEPLMYVRQSSWLAQVLATSTLTEIKNQAGEVPSEGAGGKLVESYQHLRAYLPTSFSGTDSDVEQLADLIGDLLRSLLIPRPFESDRKSSGPLKWQTYLFSPVVPELTSDETIVKSGGRELSRNQYRGGGAIAYQMLSRGSGETEEVRRSVTSERLQQLVTPRTGGLFELFSSLRSNSLETLRPETGPVLSPKPVATLNQFGEIIDTKSAEDLRDATLNILRLPDSVSNNRKVKYLLYLSGFFVARHVLERSVEQLDVKRMSEVSVLSFSRNSQIETVSRETRSRHSRLINQGVRQANSDTQNSEPSSFYNKTLQNLGFIDLRGRYMNYTLKLPLLEALILATLTQEQLTDGISISQLDQILWEKYRFVIGPDSSSLAESEFAFESFIPPSFFQENLSALAERLEQLGFVSTYSDATQILKGGF